MNTLVYDWYHWCSESKLIRPISQCYIDDTPGGSKELDKRVAVCHTSSNLRRSKCKGRYSHSMMTKTCGEKMCNLFVKCMQQVTLKRPHVPSVGGIRLLYNVYEEDQVSFVKRLQ